MEHLLSGYRRFRQTTWPAERARYETLARQGQSPAALVFACSDSRTDPQVVFDAVPGELFVVRNIAGLVPPYEPDGHYHGASAALEYGVRVLKVPRVVVLGHALCGGVQAMVEGAPDTARDFVEPWMSMASETLAGMPKDASRAARLTHVECEVVKLSLVNLMSFPWLAERVQGGDLTLHGCRFDVRSGILLWLENGRFVPVT
jgi:carbonic anhydrase